MIRKILLTLILGSFLTLLSFQIPSAMAADNPCGANPCATKNPCSENPCAVNPCATNPCGANPCGANPCAAKNPCDIAKDAPAQPLNKPIRDKAITDIDIVLKDGVRLWNDTSLGTAGLSCNTCHPDGAGLSRAPYPRYIEMAQDVVTLDQMINFCMINPMKGEAFPWNSAEMTAIAAYIMEFAKEGKSVNPCAANPCSVKNPCGQNPCASNPCTAR